VDFISLDIVNMSLFLQFKSKAKMSLHLDKSVAYLNKRLLWYLAKTTIYWFSVRTNFKHALIFLM